jgi:hypothetical protein
VVEVLRSLSVDRFAVARLAASVVAAVDKRTRRRLWTTFGRPYGRGPVDVGVGRLVA